MIAREGDVPFQAAPPPLGDYFRTGDYFHTGCLIAAYLPSRRAGNVSRHSDT